MKQIDPIRKPWAGTMTARERFNRQMHYQSVDRCFNMEFGYWDENFREWPLFYEHGITNNAEADLFFSFDRIDTIGGAPGCVRPLSRKRSAAMITRSCS